MGALAVVSQQLTLGLTLRDDATFDNFYPGENKALLTHLIDFATAAGQERFLYVWGGIGSGRTHLLQACCHAAQAPAIVLDLADPALTPEILAEMEHLHLVCLDNMDARLGQPEWEFALFHFYNRAREQGTHLLVAADVPPAQLSCQLADLRSRLSWGLVLAIVPLTDDQKLNALQLRAHRRGLELTAEVGKFLLNHYPRDLHALFSALEILDQAAMVAKHRLTIPFVKQSLNV